MMLNVWLEFGLDFDVFCCVNDGPESGSLEVEQVWPLQPVNPTILLLVTKFLLFYCIPKISFNLKMIMETEPFWPAKDQINHFFFTFFFLKP